MDVTDRLAEQIKRLRTDAGWTLDDMAIRSGVSRATLSRVEKGDVSPTAEVLSRIASAHALPLSRLLLRVEEAFEAHVPRSAQVVWRDEEMGFDRRMISPPHTSLSGEVLECTLKAGAVIRYDRSPAKGREHHLILLEGGLRLDFVERSHVLVPGDSLRYRLDGDNTFRAAADHGARYLLFIV